MAKNEFLSKFGKIWIILGNGKIIQILILFSKKKKEEEKSKGDYKNIKRSNVNESYGRDNG